jgi:hypothetical protein
MLMVTVLSRAYSTFALPVPVPVSVSVPVPVSVSVPVSHSLVKKV